MRGYQTLNVASYDHFRQHPWVQEFISRYRKDAVLATHATSRLYQDLLELNQSFIEQEDRVLFSKVEYRVKTQGSFFRKLWRIAVKEGSELGITQDTLAKMYEHIRDLAGARFACPYLDEVERVIKTVIRPGLKARGYATNLDGDPRLADQNWLESGDDAGYRAYHFFVRVPTPTNIFGDAQLVLCEVQGRSELQHIWALRSHSLLYKRDEEQLVIGLEREDMKQVSNALRAADQFMQSIRDRVAKKRESKEDA